jgi:Fe2+ transport system protein FeoA
VLSFFTRRKPSRARLLTVVDAPSATPGTAASTTGQQRTCLLAACSAGSRATVVEMRCGENEACRLRALGLCEGVSVNVVDTRHAMLVDVRGTRLALGHALTAGITVQTLPS